MDLLFARSASVGVTFMVFMNKISLYLVLTIIEKKFIKFIDKVLSGRESRRQNVFMFPSKHTIIYLSQ